jgi:hypothetical protein
MLKKISLSAMMIMGLCAGIIVTAEDKIMWYPGCFEVEGTTLKTTTVTTDPADNGMTKFTLAFKDEKSNSGFAQFPLLSKEDCPAFSLEATPEKDGIAEIWLEGDNGWKFQGKINFQAGKKQNHILELKELTSSQCRWMRVVFSNKENAKGNVIMFNNPQFLAK